MADLTQTPANVAPIGEPTIKGGTAGGTITAGDAIYPDDSDQGKMKPASSATAAQARAGGIALNGASNNQPVDWVSGGKVNPGATVAVGTIYVVSDNAGKIKPAGDLGSDEFVTVLGVGTATDEITVGVLAGEVAVP